jgi:hypothetical protein
MGIIPVPVGFSVSNVIATVDNAQAQRNISVLPVGTTQRQLAPSRINAHAWSSLSHSPTHLSAEKSPVILRARLATALPPTTAYSAGRMLKWPDHLRTTVLVASRL